MRPNLKRHGRSTSANGVEVVNISRFGFWILVDEREFFLSFDNFPWFRKATIDQICHVQREHKDHFHWPELDVDLDLDRIIHPEHYPNVSI